MGAPKELERMTISTINWPALTNRASTNVTEKKTSNVSKSKKSKSLFTDVDKKFEENCIKYILKSKIAEDLNITESSYVQDTDIQKKGVDLIVNYKGKEIKIDVKSIAEYDFKTFCFELLNSKSGRKGWLFNDELDTDYFLLTYHNVVGGSGVYSEDKKILTPENIDKTYALLIDKNKVKELVLKELGDIDFRIAVYEILTQSADMSYETPAVFSIENGELISKWSPRMRFTISRKIYERPINVVISREELRGIAEAEWVIED